MKALIISFFVFCFAQISFAQANTDSLHVLFIGNSYTHFHNLPQKLQDLALNLGYDQRLKIAHQSCTPGGYTFKRHLQNKEEIEIIKKGIWDYVILQEQSSSPAKPTEIVSKETYPYAKELVSLIKAHNPKAKIIFYMTWGHKNGSVHKIENYPLAYTYEGMQERLKISYLEMTYQNNAWCAPVGMAWIKMREERPYQPLYWPDGTHPSALGTYLAANVILATLLQEPYQSSFTDNLDIELAEYIQQLAIKTVKENKEVLNLGNNQE